MALTSSPFDQLKQILRNADHSRSIVRRTDRFALRMGRRPRVLLILAVSDNGDSVDRLAPTAFSQWGFDVDVHAAGQSPEQTARTAIENDVHAIIYPFDDKALQSSITHLIDLVNIESGGNILQIAWKKTPDRHTDNDQMTCFDQLLSIGNEILPGLSQLLDRLEAHQHARLGPEDYLDGVMAGDRTVMAKAITLVESTRPEHQQAADSLIEKLLPLSGNALRIGISGIPGAGKSSFIETFGMMLADMGYRLAVLAVDPSSAITGGSVLGDKDRMKWLSGHPNTFIRPTASGGTLGGITQKTRESIIVCDAAGFDIVLVETVGVGQSETSVASMVDFLMVLFVAGAGDEFQGIKKGILELSHAIVINKADGSNIDRAKEAQRVYRSALSIIQHESPLWTIPVLTCSSLRREGIHGIWEMITDFRSKMDASGEFEKNRRSQTVNWMWARLEEGLNRRFHQRPDIKTKISEITKDVEMGKISPTDAAFKLLDLNN